MKRSILGSYLLSILLAPEADGTGGGGGGVSTVTGDADLDTAVMAKLGLNMEGAPAGTKETKGTKEAATEKPAGGAGASAAEKADAAAKETERLTEKADDLGVTIDEVKEIEKAEAKERKRVEAKAKEAGKTADEIVAEETAEEERIAARMEETGKTREEILAEEETGTEENEGDEAPDLSDEQKAWVDAQLEAGRAELTAKVEELEQAAARITELETQLQSAGEQPVQVAQIDPLFLIDDPAKLEEQDRRLAQFEKWLLQNFDGTEEIPASEGKAAVPAYTAKEIRERYQLVKETREKVLPAARQAIGQRRQHEAAAKRVYPELFDAKRPEHKIAQGILKLAPGLRAVIPNIHVVIGDAIVGERIRLQKEKAAKGAGKTAAAAGAARPKIAPKVPARPTAGAGAVRTSGPGKGKAGDAGIDVGKFMEKGGDRAALVASINS